MPSRLALALLILLAWPSARVAAQVVDVELVFAVDASGSIDESELLLQRQGYAEALASDPVQDAISFGAARRIAVLFIEWAGPGDAEVILDWRIIGDRPSAEAWGRELLAQPRKTYGYNDLADAIDKGAAAIKSNAIEGRKLVIDVSGDGPNIGGRPIRDARDEAVRAGITINALVLLTSGRNRGPGGMPIDEYYEREVIGGIGAFMLPVKEKRDFVRALIGKMVREIAGLEIDTRALRDHAASAGSPSSGTAIQDRAISSRR